MIHDSKEGSLDGAYSFHQDHDGPRSRSISKVSLKKGPNQALSPGNSRDSGRVKNGFNTT